MEDFPEVEFPPSYFASFELSDLEFVKGEFDKQDISESIESSIWPDDDIDSVDVIEEMSDEVGTTEVKNVDFRFRRFTHDLMSLRIGYRMPY